MVGCGRQAGAELEITPVMVREALRVLYRSGRLQSETPGPDELLVQEMLQSALSANPVARAAKR
jgi:hypothetical protein